MTLNYYRPEKPPKPSGNWVIAARGRSGASGLLYCLLWQPALAGLAEWRAGESSETAIGGEGRLAIFSAAALRHGQPAAGSGAEWVSLVILRLIIKDPAKLAWSIYSERGRERTNLG